MITLFMQLVKQQLYPDSCGKNLPHSIDPKLVGALMTLGQMHDLTAVVGNALLEQKQILLGEFQQPIQKAVCRAAAICEKNMFALAWLRQLLEENGVPFIPLKGSVVRNYYPEPWMRSSCDIDILIPPERLDETVAMLIENGCSMYCEKKQHDVSLLAPGNVHLELHYRMLECTAQISKVLDRVWEHSRLVAGKRYEYVQTGEFLLFHLLAHMANHLIYGGCGIRSFVDIWLLEKRMPYDKKILYRLCREAGLETFYDTVHKLFGVWFDGDAHTDITRQLEQIVIRGGTFGNADNRILIDQAQSGGKQKQLLKRIFMPYDDLKTQYPILENKHWLMPVYQVIRWGRIFTGGRLHRAAQEYKTGKSHSESQVDAARQLLKDIGLDFM